MIPLAKLQERGERLIQRSFANTGLTWREEEHNLLVTFVSEVLGELGAAHDELESRSDARPTPQQETPSPVAPRELFLLLQLHRNSVLPVGLLASPEDATALGSELASRVFGGPPARIYGEQIDGEHDPRKGWDADGTAMLRLRYTERGVEWAVCALTPTDARTLAPAIQAAFAARAAAEVETPRT
jgi:hypothetical protein